MPITRTPPEALDSDLSTFSPAQARLIEARSPPPRRRVDRAFPSLAVARGPDDGHADAGTPFADPATGVLPEVELMLGELTAGPPRTGSGMCGRPRAS